MCLKLKLKLRSVCWKRNQRQILFIYSLRLELIIRLPGGLEIHKRPCQRFSKRLSPHTRMLTNCRSRVSVSQLSSSPLPPCICILILNSAHKSIDLAWGGKLLSSLQRSKKKERRKLLNCAILPIAKSLNWAWQCKEGRERERGQVAWYGFNELRVELELDWNNGNKSCINQLKPQAATECICICISRDTFSHAFQLQTR